MSGDTINRIGRIYAYTVCLAAIITFLLVTAAIVGALYDRANPLRTEFGGSDALTSFEAFKAMHGNENPVKSKKANSPDTLSDATLREQYAARVSDRIADVQFTTSKSLGTNGMVLLLAVGLFWAHWRWVRRADRLAAA